MGFPPFAQVSSYSENKCITSRKMLWKTSLSHRVGLHWGAIRCALYWSLFHNFPWWLVLQSCSFCILQLLLQQRIVVWLASSIFFSWFSSAPGVDEYVERLSLDPHSQWIPRVLVERWNQVAWIFLAETWVEFVPNLGQSWSLAL